MVAERNIRMVDLRRQYEKIKSEVDAGIQEVIDSTAFINGPAVKSFQAELEAYLGVRHVIPCANGTDALQIAMMALGLKPGDEVITASFTYVATAEVIGVLGLTPVLVDVNPDLFTLDVEDVKRRITPKTKAIVPVHLFGQCAEMDALMALARARVLYVIEDNAQAIGADYKSGDGRQSKAGTIGHIGTTSFFPSKNLGCYGDGGAIYTDDDALAAKMRMIAHHGQSTLYVHDVLGMNSRLDTIQAAVLRVKLRHLDAYAAARSKVAEQYDRAFSGQAQLKIPVRNERSTHVFHQYTLTLKDTDRDKLKTLLAGRGIPSMVYYPIPLHKQKAFASERNKDGFGVTEKLCDSVLSLPMHTELTAEDVKFITDSVLEFLPKAKLS
jgi:UDP-2-acetamido-2-deoxy-ribo-hexuluronate aminotransferase